MDADLAETLERAIWSLGLGPAARAAISGLLQSVSENLAEGRTWQGIHEMKRLSVVIGCATTTTREQTLRLDRADPFTRSRACPTARSRTLG